MVAAIQNEANVIDDELLAQALVEEVRRGRRGFLAMGRWRHAIELLLRLL